MPAARESLLDAAYTALTRRAWAHIRMVDVAATAGVSRQTLYNEFGSKEGLARALVRRETDNYLAGVERALTRRPAAAGPGEEAAARMVAAAAWTVRTARTNPLVRAVLTGCWNDRLPAPPRPGPAELVGGLRDRAVAALEPDWPEEELPALGAACETAARLTLSCVVAPAGRAGQTGPDAVSTLVRGAFARVRGGRDLSGGRDLPGGLSGPSPTAAAR
ncbi:TetR/AcrR family transcriptional regulator [Streptomyces sp. NPDC048650]|uniref:TetR/AcrR family transcriptional regulator n=1 Tax=unclassified Streptomyces TaxID=2593676 RepID=UPI0037147D2F